MKRLSGRIVRSLPATLICIRFLLGPLLLLSVLDCKSSSNIPCGYPWFIIGFTIAFLSDVFDGIIARRLDVVTEKLREYDGWVDTWFYCWILGSTWLAHQDVIVAFRVPLLIVVSTQLISWGIDWLKYRRLTSYHLYSSKAWGLTLFVAFIALFGFNYAGFAFWLTIIVGIISHIEEMAMTLTLPYWIHDVPSIVHALRIRQEASKSTLPSSPPRRRRA
jgi:phosphatidylglycerophosphate synthase